MKLLGDRLHKNHTQSLTACDVNDSRSLSHSRSISFPSAASISASTSVRSDQSMILPTFGPHRFGVSVYAHSLHLPALSIQQLQMSVHCGMRECSQWSFMVSVDPYNLSPVAPSCRRLVLIVEIEEMGNWVLGFPFHGPQAVYPSHIHVQLS